MRKKAIRLSVAARREQNWGWFMVAPTIIGLLILNVWPFIQTLYASFCEHLGFGHYKFIGFENYINMFQDADFIHADDMPARRCPRLCFNILPLWFCIFSNLCCKILRGDEHYLFI